MRIIVLTAIFATACSFDTGGTADESGSTTDGTTTTTTSTTTMPTSSTTVGTTVDESSTAAPETSTGEPGTSSETGPTEPLQHGFVRFQLQADAGERGDPFAGTTRITISMSYETCIFEFYVENPEYGQMGDMGPEIFGPADEGGEGWLDRLCDLGLADAIDCSVASFEQQLEGIPGLRIGYSVGEPLEGGVLAFGPLPTAELAACEGGTAPTVRLTSGGSVRGFDGANTLIWEGSTFAPNAAATGDEQPIVVDVVAID